MEQNSGRKQCQRMYKATSCAVCSAVDALQRHHMNGDACDNRAENVQILCRSCHEHVHMMIGNWGKGMVKQATCKICGVVFKPKRTRRATLCGSAPCAAESGKRSAALRWGS